MGIPNAPKPATARHGEPAPNGELLGGGLDLQNSDHRSGIQESDFAYFVSRPMASTRIRLPFPDEFDQALIEAFRGSSDLVTMVIVAIERDATGSPTRRARGLCFGQEGRS